jgi:adenine-specific DNA-methyltransferase
MNLKQALLTAFEAQQLKELCAELKLEADRRSRDAMVAVLSTSKRAKPELLILELTVAQLRTVLEELEQPTGGRKEELVQRLLAAAGRAKSVPQATTLAVGHHWSGKPEAISPETRPTASSTSDLAAEYRHKDQAVQRPEAGVQDQFQTKKPPRVYRYDSSLDPSLSWDEQRERDLGEWLLGLIVRAAKEGDAAAFAEPQVWKGGGVRVTSVVDAAQMLQQIGKPLLNWAGKAERHEIRVPTAPLFVHERHSTKAVLDGIRHRKARGQTLDLFGDAGMDIRENLEAYEHKGPWQNRMILGDSLAVMNSLLEFEGLAGQVQMIYIDPPYGVKFGSNFQPFVRKRDVKHNSDVDMTREPEMVKAYRDTWKLGLHSYLTYLRDRLTIARELLTQSGSLFVQINDENIHHVRELLDEVFGSPNAVSIITFKKTTSTTGDRLASVSDYLLWYAKDLYHTRYNRLHHRKHIGGEGAAQYTWIELSDGTRRRAEQKDYDEPPAGSRFFRPDTLTSQRPPGSFPIEFEGRTIRPVRGYWKTGQEGIEKLKAARRLTWVGDTLCYVRYINDFPAFPISNLWDDTVTSGFSEPKQYIVQTHRTVIQRCILMTTHPGDLILDPTCGSGTSAYVAEQWGRRWITGDTSRVPLALARQRLLTATFPYYKLKSPQDGPAGGFVYERKQNRKGQEFGGLVPHTTLKSIANNEPPAMELLVDRPEEAVGVTRVSGPFVVEATIAPVQPLETAGDDTPVNGDVSMHIQRMTEMLRQSKTLRLPGNRELTLAGVRRTVDTEYLHAEAKERDKRVAIVFGPADGAVSTTLVYEAGREAYYLKYERLYFFAFAVEPGARAMIEDEKKLRTADPRYLRGRDAGRGDVGPAEDHARLGNFLGHRAAGRNRATCEEKRGERAAALRGRIEGSGPVRSRVRGYRVGRGGRRCHAGCWTPTTTACASTRHRSFSPRPVPGTTSNAR